MKTAAEHPIDEIAASEYKASLLTAFSTKSKYADLWSQLKHSRVLHINLDTRLYKHHKQFSDSLGRLHKQDHYFREFCILEFGKPLNFYSRKARDMSSMVIKLLNDDDYHRHLSENCTKEPLSKFE